MTDDRPGRPTPYRCEDCDSAIRRNHNGSLFCTGCFRHWDTETPFLQSATPRIEAESDRDGQEQQFRLFADDGKASVLASRTLPKIHKAAVLDEFEALHALGLRCVAEYENWIRQYRFRMLRLNQQMEREEFAWRLNGEPAEWDWTQARAIDRELSQLRERIASAEDARRQRARYDKLRHLIDAVTA